MTRKWNPFNSSLGSNQELPPRYKSVLVYVPEGAEIGRAASIAVGYRKDGAGDPESPYFVTPGVGHTPTMWCDIDLPEVQNLWAEIRAAEAGTKEGA